MLIILALLLLCYEGGMGRTHCSTVHENNTDLLSLLDFKQAITNDPTGALRSWHTGIQYCRWKGVACSPTRTGRVWELNLTGQSLAGQITSSLGNLTFLSMLDLSSNSFSGELPPLNHLQRLHILFLNNNFLQGTIPDALTNCSNLRQLDLSQNLLEGAIPPNIGLLSNLVVLILKKNNLNGIIPPTLRNATDLEELDLQTNQLQGSIPDELGQLSKLLELLLGGNKLSGGIPRSLFNLTFLRKLDLYSNMLDGALPPYFGDALPDLRQLTLGGNMFEGHIPASLGNASGLEMISLANNSFTGPIPISFGKLSRLWLLFLFQNKLEARDSESWKFLHALGNCSQLQLLALNENQLQGAIPNSIGNLSINLQILLLGSNNLSGKVPLSIENLHGLIKLGLGDNGFSGSIEEWSVNMKNIQELLLHDNNFIGSIPSYIGNLTRLTRLSLARNKFEGLIPPTLGNLTQLLNLDLSYNNLQGNIPLDFGNLKQLTELHLSSNKLTGEIPDTLSQCHNLVTIEMDQNFLEGNISIFSKIEGLSMLNLSHNNLSGTIPTTLNSLLLSKLDLSYNHLQGEIPRNGVFENATAVSLGGNWGLCGGAMALHMPSCPAVSRRIKGHYCLVEVLIPIFGFMSLTLLVYFLLLEKKMPRKTYSSLPSFGEHFHKVSYKDLAQATRNFSESNLVGRGSYGSVYRGKLWQEVAVKVFDLEMQGADKSFMSECEALRSIQHRNLLSIITACSTIDNRGNVFKALVYKFIPNGNLDTWLHHKGDGKAPKRLGLTQRIGIAVNIADALNYLHHDCGRTTIHCDLKPSNILLDDDMNALLGDFGIASFYSTSILSVSSICVKGTIGYIAPEYAGGGHASTSGDVYSFGIVMLEMMTGKRPTDPMFRDGLNIINFVDSYFPHQIFHVTDAHLIEEFKDFAQANMVPENALYECLVSLLQVALSCTHPLPSERMNMKEIASKMHGIKTSSLGWKTKICASLE